MALLAPGNYAAGMNRRSPRLTLIVVLTIFAFASGCTRQIHLLGTRTTAAQETIGCQKRCQEQGEQSGNRDTYLACVENCPGVTEHDGTCKAADLQDEVLFCEDRSAVSKGKVAAGIGLVVLTLAWASCYFRLATRIEQSVAEGGGSGKQREFALGR